MLAELPGQLRRLADELEQHNLCEAARRLGMTRGQARAGRQELAAHFTKRGLAPTPLRVAAINLEQLAFLVLFLALTVVVWRRFGAPYGVFCAVSLAIPLSAPAERWPLLSIPRFGLVVFPFFLALAALGGRPRIHTAIVGVSAIMLGVAVSQWALWQWVA